MGADADFDEILELEHDGWRSLCDGTGDEFYGSIMTPHARMVLAGGTVMSRDEVIDSLGHAPPWASYEIEDPSFTPIGNGSVALVYVGTGHRDDGGDFTAVMTSVYVREGSGWQLAHYQQTPKH